MLYPKKLFGNILVKENSILKKRNRRSLKIAGFVTKSLFATVIEQSISNPIYMNLIGSCNRY